MTKPGTKRSRMGAWVAVLLLSASAAGAETEGALPAGEDYGAGLTLEEITPLRDVVSRPELHVDRTLLVKGRIRDVCQKKGCWMVLADGESQIPASVAAAVLAGIANSDASIVATSRGIMPMLAKYCQWSLT